MLRLLAALLVAGVAAPATASAAVVLNEISCTEDWIELANTASSPADVSGWILTDEELPRPSAAHRYVFAAGRSIPGHGHLRVGKGKLEAGRPGLPFGVSCGDDTIRLARSASAATAVDAVVVPELTREEDTYGRYPTATGSWRQTIPTKRRANEPSPARGTTMPESSWLFDPTTVHEIAVTLPQPSQDALAARPKEYVPATFSMTAAGATYGPYAVGLRLKGDQSFRPLTGKAALRVKFDHAVRGQRFHGLRSLTLNNMVQDHSMVHEAVAYEAFRHLGLPASRSGFAFVSVNGAAYGVYANVETIDREMLRRWPAWFDGTRHLFEGEVDADVTPEGVARLETDAGDPADRGDLAALAGAVAQAGAPYWERMAPVADLLQLTHYWAAEKYLGHRDGYTGHQRNFYLHSDERGVFRMLPAGMDQALGKDLGYGVVTEGGQAGRLFTACLEDPVCKQQYLAAVAHVRRTLAGARLDQRVDQIAAALRPWQERDPRREQSLEKIAESVAKARRFVATRAADHTWEERDGHRVLEPGLPPGL